MELVCHLARPLEPCPFPRPIPGLSPRGAGLEDSAHGEDAADVPSVQPWGISRSGDLPMDELMCGDSPSAFIPAVHPLFPKAGSTGQAPCCLQDMGSPAVAGPCFPCDRGGTGPAATVFGQLQAVPSPRCKARAPPWLSRLSHLSVPGWGWPFPPSLLCSPWPFSLLVSPSLPVPPLFADPAAGLGEALIHHRAPCQLCHKSETERGTQLWNKPLHDPV